MSTDAWMVGWFLAGAAWALGIRALYLSVRRRPRTMKQVAADNSIQVQIGGRSYCAACRWLEDCQRRGDCWADADRQREAQHRTAAE